MPRTSLAVLAVAVALLPARADKPRPAEPAAAWFIDDDDLFDQFMAKLRGLAKADKCLPSGRLQNLTSEDRTTRLTLPPPATARLDPEDVYRKALPSVFLLGSVSPDVTDGGPKVDNPRADGYIDGRLATAWALTADGVVVTNWHVFDALDDGEVFGVMDHRGEAYPVTDVLAVDRAADIAILKIDAKGLTPLPVAARPAPVGAWVGVLGHPGDRYFTFTQGAVTRYSKVKPADAPAERWMAISADYASGSSGSPVLDRTGSVVGMAALTESLGFPDAGPEPPPAPTRRRQPPAEPPAPPAAAGTSQQMVVKLAVPAGEIRKAVWAR
jgi:serine protease Do